MDRSAEKAGIAYMDVGKAREHMYRKYGIRTTQEQLSRSGSFAILGKGNQPFLQIAPCSYTLQATQRP